MVPHLTPFRCQKSPCCTSAVSGNSKGDEILKISGQYY